MKRLIKTWMIFLMLGSMKILSAQAFPPDPLSLPYHAFIEDTRLSKELALSQEQKDKIKDIVFDMEKEAEKIRSEIRIKEIELRELFLEKNPDPKKIENKVREIGKITTELRILKINEFLKIKGILTDEQWIKLKEILQKRPFLRKKIRERLWEKE